MHGVFVHPDLLWLYVHHGTDGSTGDESVLDVYGKVGFLLQWDSWYSLRSVMVLFSSIRTFHMDVVVYFHH